LIALLKIKVLLFAFFYRCATKVRSSFVVAQNGSILSFFHLIGSGISIRSSAI
jgi:hypothetical protein